MLEEINNIRKDIIEYVEVRMDLIKLHTAENISRLFSQVAIIAVIGYLLFLILLFMSLGAALFFGAFFNLYILGFFCVAIFYFFILVIFILLRKKIIERPIIKAIVKMFFPKFSDNEKESDS